MGINIKTPTEKLHISGGTIRIEDGTEQSGYVLTSNANGVATWQASSGGVSLDPYNNVGSATTATSLTWDVSGTSTNYEVTLTGNTTLLLTNVRNGDYGTLIVNQDATGGRTLGFDGAFGPHYVVNGGGGSLTLTATGNARDIISFTYNGTAAYWTVGNDYT